MANYKESTVAGNKWQRAWQVVIENKYNQIPKIDFYEETVVDVGDGQPVSKLLPESLHAEFTDGSIQFNLLNPIDGSVIGSATYQDAYVLLQSLYMHLANLRDGN
jgi:hypothetical protein